MLSEKEEGEKLRSYGKDQQILEGERPVRNQPGKNRKLEALGLLSLDSRGSSLDARSVELGAPQVSDYYLAGSEQAVPFQNRLTR
ncbi:hypothetical protein E4U56_002710 [Claviceps arundinis]|uniref:Uncharacterized protein n=1 Tax=Claviceps arundinis TaxID=1623583 RepID=A0A9P7SP43_9HYPO|nr:hypothetical protein E4U56_002710 [Claviceps arundinis]